MVLGGPGDYLFLRAPSFFAVCIKGFTCRLLAAFPCSLVAMLCLPMKFFEKL